MQNGTINKFAKTAASVGVALGLNGVDSAQAGAVDDVYEITMHGRPNEVFILNILDNDTFANKDGLEIMGPFSYGEDLTGRYVDPHIQYFNLWPLSESSNYKLMRECSYPQQIKDKSGNIHTSNLTFKFNYEDTPKIQTRPAPAGAAPIVAKDDWITITKGIQIVFFDPTANDDIPQGRQVVINDVQHVYEHDKPRLAPVHGTNDMAFYTPDIATPGHHELTYTLKDEYGHESTATVHVWITDDENNLRPIAIDDEFVFAASGTTTFNVLANDTDPNGDPLQVVSFSPPYKGTLIQVDNGQFSYTPDPAYFNEQGFSYVVSDGKGGYSTARVTLLPISDQSKNVLSRANLQFKGSAVTASVISHSPEYSFNNGTLQFIITPETVNGTQGIFSKDATGNGNGGHLTILTEGKDVYARFQSTTSSYELRASNALVAGRTSCFALTFGAKGMNLYSDGNLVDYSSYTGGLLGNNEPIVLGAESRSSTSGTTNSLANPFNGKINALNLYNVQFTDDEVTVVTTHDPQADIGHLTHLIRDGKNFEYIKLLMPNTRAQIALANMNVSLSFEDIAILSNTDPAVDVAYISHSVMRGASFARVKAFMRREERWENAISAILNSAEKALALSALMPSDPEEGSMAAYIRARVEAMKAEEPFVFVPENFPQTLERDQSGAYVYEVTNTGSRSLLVRFQSATRLDQFQDVGEPLVLAPLASHSITGNTGASHEFFRCDVQDAVYELLAPQQ